MFYFACISFLVGVGIATIWGVSLPVVAWVLILALSCMVAARWSASLSRRALVSLGVLFAGCAIGLLRFEIASWQFGHSSLAGAVGDDVMLEGLVVREPEERGASTQVYVEVGDDLVLVSADAFTDVAYGDVVQVTGELSVPESFTTELGRTFNYPAYLLARGVEYRVSFADVTILESGQGNSFVAGLLGVKQHFIYSLEQVLGEPYAGLGEGLLLGVKQALGEDIESAFRTSGIIHIVVLSGYNVMLVVSFILFILSLFFKRTTRLIVGMVAVVCFALLVGLTATVVRASIMAGVLLLADLLGRRYHVPRALLLAAVGMVCINPYLLIYDIGFQLSFMATLGLVLVAPVFETFITEGFSQVTLRNFFISTLATQIAVLPLLIYHIGEVSLVAVVVNILVLPMVSFAMLATCMVGVSAMISLELAFLLGVPTQFLLGYIIDVAVFFAALPFAAYVVPPVSPWVIPLSYAGLGAGLLYWFRVFPKKQTDAAQWVIEEESEKTDEAFHASSVPTTIPIFFR